MTILGGGGTTLGRYVFHDLSRLHAGGANRNPFRNAVVQNADALQIRHPAPLCRVVGVRNVIARHRGLTANFTNLGHY